MKQEKQTMILVHFCHASTSYPGSSPAPAWRRGRAWVRGCHASLISQISYFASWKMN